MSNYIKKFYYINGKVFDEATSQKSLAFAKKYAKDNNLDESQIYTLVNKSELAYLEELLKQEDVSEIETHKPCLTMLQFTNANGDTMPQLDIQCSFKYKQGGNFKYVAVIDSVYELTKLFVLQKMLVDFYGKEHGWYLKVLYLENGEWREWKIQDVAPFVKEKQEQHKKKLAQMRAIRDKQKYDRLLRLRSEGKITERQSQELYRLEKVFGG